MNGKGTQGLGWETLCDLATLKANFLQEEVLIRWQQNGTTIHISMKMPLGC